jgi:hypothetical protein
MSWIRNTAINILNISKCIVQRDGFVYMWCNSIVVLKIPTTFILYNCSQLGSQLPTEDNKNSNIKHLVASATLFLFFILQTGIETSTFCIYIIVLQGCLVVWT